MKLISIIIICSFAKIKRVHDISHNENWQTTIGQEHVERDNTKTTSRQRQMDSVHYVMTIRQRQVVNGQW